MSYNTISNMARDNDLMQRFIACAAQEGVTNPEVWVSANRWELVSDTEAVASYQYAADLDTDDIGFYGKRSAVINDTKILSIVQTRIAALA